MLDSTKVSVEFLQLETIAVGQILSPSRTRLVKTACNSNSYNQAQGKARLEEASHGNVDNLDTKRDVTTDNIPL